MRKEYCCTILDETVTLGFSEICTLCRVEHSLICQMVDEGVLTPEGTSPEDWRFNGLAVKRIQVTLRLQSHLGVNLPGVALALDLLEELDELRSRFSQIP